MVDLSFQRLGVVVLPLVVIVGAAGLHGDGPLAGTSNLVLRAVAIYVLVWLVFRLAGRRAFAEMNSFDLVPVLIVSEATQQALLGEDSTISGAVVVVATLVTMDAVVASIGARIPSLGRLLDGVPALLVRDGKPFLRRMRSLRVGVDDVLEEARRGQGIERMEDIRWAVLERDGHISVAPRGSDGK